MSRDKRIDAKVRTGWGAKALEGTLHRVSSVAAKEMRHILRDGRTFFMVFISPAFTLVMLSYLFTWDVEHFTLGLFDRDRSSLSRQYISALTEDGTITLSEDISSSDRMDELLLTGRVQGVLVVPPGLMERLSAGAPGEIQVILDGTNPSTISQMLSQLQGRTESFATGLSSLSEAVQAQLMPIETRRRVWYNANLRALYSMVPGLMAVVMCMPAFSIATSLTREKEVGTMEGLFATPLGGADLLLGKLAAYLACGVISAVPAMLVATLWFGVPFRGSLPLFLLLTADFLLGALGLSLFLANFLSSQQAAMVVLFLAVFVPSMFLSGLIDPIDRTSLSAQLQANFLPTTHYVAISRGLFLKGVGLSALWTPAAILASMGMGYLLLTVRLFKKRFG
jgi:ABC-2 type transport system permease protein